jgi:hypothetical protein
MHDAPPAKGCRSSTYAGDVATQLPVFNCMLVCAATPIDLGPPSTSVYLELYGTGIRGRTSLSEVSVMLGGVSLQVTYAGAQITYPGLDQQAHSLCN